MASGSSGVGGRTPSRSAVKSASTTKALQRAKAYNKAFKAATRGRSKF